MTSKNPMKLLMLFNFFLFWTLPRIQDPSGLSLYVFVLLIRFVSNGKASSDSTTTTTTTLSSSHVYYQSFGCTF